MSEVHRWMDGRWMSRSDPLWTPARQDALEHATLHEREVELLAADRDRLQVYITGDRVNKCLLDRSGCVA